MRTVHLATALALIALCPLAHGGISEPGILLYGEVRDAGGQLLQSGGTVTWTYTPVTTGQAVTIVAPLSDVVAKDGTHYSYSIEVPLETAASGFPLGPTALRISGTDCELTSNRYT